jgi:monoamine oxidase
MRVGFDTNERPEADVAIVGAGLSGLMAGRTLLRAGYEPIVLEARDRVGGRVLVEPIDDGVVELGGTWVSYKNERLRALLQEQGIDVFPTFVEGTNLIDAGDGVRSFRGNVPRLRLTTLLDVAWVRRRLDKTAVQVPPAAPWTAARARKWDGMSVGAWLDQNVRTRQGRTLWDAAVASIWAAEPAEVNLLTALTFISSVGSFGALSGTSGLLRDRMVGGPTRLAQSLADELGNRVVSNSPINAVVDHGSHVELRSGDVTITARRAIIAVPPRLAAAIHFEPGLPVQRRRALENLPMGSIMKVAAVYDRPFWRDRGLSGRAILLNGPITTVFDFSPPNGSAGALVGYVPGRRARELGALPSAERREAIISTFARLYGEEAARPQQFVEKNWTEDLWSGGCYLGLPAIGTMVDFLPLIVEPIGALHWAGSETAFGSYGGMNGAVLSGERAAGEAAAALESSRMPSRV